MFSYFIHFKIIRKKRRQREIFVKEKRGEWVFGKFSVFSLELLTEN